MSDIYFEEGLEKVFIDFIESLGYTYVPHQTIVRDSMKSPIASEVFEESLLRINPDLPEEVIEQAIYQVKNIDAGLLATRNETFFEYLQNGMEISHYTDGRLKTERVHLIDYKDIDNNLFIVTNQLTIKGKDTKRPDIILYVNGLPLVVIELKSMTSAMSDVSSAYRQIKNYQVDISS